MALFSCFLRQIKFECNRNLFLQHVDVASGFGGIEYEAPLATRNPSSAANN